MKELTVIQELKEDLELAIDSVNDALNDIIDETTRSCCKMVVKITIGNILKRINNELIEKEKQQIIDAVLSCDKYGTQAEDYYNETFKKK